MKTPKTKDFWRNENIEQKNYLNTKFELIKEISNEEMNKECFDCRKKEPKYISINNSIFLCEDCAIIHKGFPDNISFIIDNNLNLLSNNYLKYLYYGGNANLDNFINYDYPGLQNYSPEILYKTQAMIYYREKLKCKIEGKPKPLSPNDIMAYKLVSENGLINIREGNKFKSKKNLTNRISNKDIINNYYNNFNNTYNTYNNYNYNYQNNNNFIINENKKINKNKNNNRKSLKYCSLVNKAFFNEMKNLFDKKCFKNAGDKDNKNNKSYGKISKTKNKYNNYTIPNKIIDKSLNKSLTYRLNDSINYSNTNRTNVNEQPSTNRKLNKSSFSDEGHKSPNKYDYSPRYIKPLVKITQLKKNTLNNFCTEKENFKKKKLTIDLAQITRYNNTINTLKNNDKIYKQKKRISNFFKISKNKNKNDEKNNLSFEIDNKNNDKNKDLLNKINKKMKLYIFNNYFNKMNKQENFIKKVKTIEKQTEVEYNSNYNNTSDRNEDLKINNYRKKIILNKNVKKNKYLNKSYFDEKERKPIKVNLSLNYNNNCLLKKKEDDNIKKKALKDKKEQEKLEQEALHNLLFEKKDSDLFNNIIYLNNNDK